jgi:hypothetical protein
MAASATMAGSQEPVRPPLTINVRVVDSGAVAVGGAEVAVVQGLNDTRANSTTDARGLASLTISNPDGSYQIIVRKIGFLREAEFFRARPGPLTFQIVMQRAVQSLAPVEVNAREDVTRKSYFIDADEIAKHADELIDASDILKKLKPDMVCGRSCSPWGGGVPASVRTAVRSCPISTPNPSGCRRMAGSGSTPGMSRTSAWVNGQRILMIATDPVCLTGKRGALTGLPAGTMQVLCEILPEHIEQIQYVDEFDNSIGKVGSNSALFIVLKEGVVYEPGKQSYVRDPSARIPGIRAALPGVQSSLAPPPALTAMPDHDSATAHPDSTPAMPSYRYRVLGVFDQDTGDVIEGARVVDVNTGTYANTSSTGTVSLVFLPEGGSLLRVTKAGYEDLNLTVDIGPTAATPLTLLMKKKAEGRDNAAAVDGPPRP